MVSTYGDARDGAMHLDYYYSRRAERQQTFLDAGSLITIIGAAGAFQGNLSNQTREAWGVVAFTPSIVSQFNVYEPTRELFHGGSVAVQLITLRYDRLLRSMDRIQPARTPASDCSPFSTAVSNIRSRRIVDPRRRPALPPYDVDGVLLNDAVRLAAVCEMLRSRAGALDFAVESARRLRSSFAQDYAADLLALDEALLAKDRDLRNTPIETLASILTSPLRAADFAITGENTKAAVDALKTQVAFSGLSRSLATVALPELPRSGVVPTPAGLSDAAIALAGGSNSPDLKADTENLRSLGAELISLQAQQAYAEHFASELIRAAEADYLTFSYDATTNTTLVTVGPSPAPGGGVTRAGGGGAVPTS